MPMYVFMMFVAVSTLLTLARWRRGIFLMIAIAMLADPVRKLTPGVPAYLVMAPLPVWAAMMYGAWRKRELSWWVVRDLFPGAWRLFRIYLLTLVVPMFLSLTYGPGSWKFTLLGLLTQAGFLGSLLLGILFPSRPGDVARLMKWYCVVAAVMMTGSLMERANIGFASGLIGSEMLGAEWVTYRMGEGLHMVSGFFRSPDMMGWHASNLVMFGIILALGSPRDYRAGWAVAAGWGGVALIFCARRKMMSMLPVFVGATCLLHVVQGHYGRLVRLMLTVGIMIGVAGYLYLHTGTQSSLERFYASTLDEVEERVQGHGIDAVMETYRQAGFWGHGLGMAVQGGHNIKGAKPRTWQESGPSMLAADIGIPGLVAFGLLMLSVMQAGYRALRHAGDSTEHAVLLGVGAVVLANMAAGVVSAQVFGDPFIGCFLPFLMGVVLAAARLEHAPMVAVSDAVPGGELPADG